MQHHSQNQHHYHNRTGQSSKTSEDFCDDGILLKENDKEYYNDLPNKLPPDLLSANGCLQEPHQNQQHHHYSSNPIKVAQLNLKKGRDYRLSSNLIDLNSPPPDKTTNKMNLNAFETMRESSTEISNLTRAVGSLPIASTVMSTTIGTAVNIPTTAATQNVPDGGRPRDVFDTRMYFNQVFHL